MDNQHTDIKRIGFADTINLYSDDCNWYPDTHFDGEEIDEQEDDFLLIHNSGFNYNSDPFRTSYYKISMCTKGQANQTINGSSIELDTNALLFLSPRHITNKVSTNAGNEIYDLLFTRQFLTGAKIPDETLDMLLWIDPADNPVLRLNEVDNALAIFEKIKEETKNPQLFYRQIVRYSIIEFLFRINRIDKQALQDGKDPTTQGYKIYKEFKYLVDTHYKKHKSVNDYAELLHITPKYLSKIVKQQSGDTALDVIHDRIIAEAKNLLGFTNKPSKQIAYDLGFKTPSYFSRFFKTKTGISPSKYRKNRSIEH